MMVLRAIQVMPYYLSVVSWTGLCLSVEWSGASDEGEAPGVEPTDQSELYTATALCTVVGTRSMQQPGAGTSRVVGRKAGEERRALF